MKTTNNLKSVDLSGNRISDESAKFICKATSESNIERLSLFKNRITEKCID
jgi:Ran GTPase-activating protein (RanGAP) involved in mRNA processing and transport